MAISLPSWRHATLGYNGLEGRVLLPEEVWTAWTKLAGELARMTQLQSHFRGLAALVHETLKAAKRQRSKKRKPSKSN